MGGGVAALIRAAVTWRAADGARAAAPFGRPSLRRPRATLADVCKTTVKEQAPKNSDHRGEHSLLRFAPGSRHGAHVQRCTRLMGHS